MSDDKVFSILLRRRSGAGDYSCPDGELESVANAEIVDCNGGAVSSGNVSDSDSSGDADDSGGSGGVAGPDGFGGFTGPGGIYGEERVREWLKGAEIFDEPEGAASVARIGDVAVATAKDGLHYFLYDHERGKWVQLGEMPGAPPVEFALKKSVLGGWHIHPDMLPSQIVEQGEPTGDGWGMKAAQLLDDFGREVTEAGLFAEPFFALAAYRLADGSHILPSPPVLMTPNSGVPIVSGSADFSVATMKMSVAAAVCALQWRVKPQESLSRWAGVISHLDIFISRPVSLSAPGGMRALHRTECKNFTHCIDAYAHAGEHRVWSDTIVQGWAPRPVDEAALASAIAGVTSFHKIGEVAAESLCGMEEFSDVKFNCGSLSSLESLEAYTPGYAVHSPVAASACGVCSGRLMLWDFTLSPPPAPTFSESVAYGGESGFTPRWLFHPDPDARTCTLRHGGDEITLPLRRHPSLRGSCYWGGYGERNDEAEPDKPDSPAVNLPARQWGDIETGSWSGGVWRSARRNPFVMPDSLLMRLDVERVIAVCRAFRSSGLVAATSPTAYAFTSEEIFLLKESDDGTFKDAGLISTHRLRDAGSVTVGGRSVEFVTDSGEVMRIEGTVVKSGGAESGTGVSGTGSGSGAVCLRASGEGMIEFTTRPLKPGGRESWKRLRAVALRISRENEEVSLSGERRGGDGVNGVAGSELSVYGSRDLMGWSHVATGRGVAIRGRWPGYWRFFKIKARVSPAAGMAVEGIAMRLEE